jgi:hypothetical protein
VQEEVPWMVGMTEIEMSGPRILCAVSLPQGWDQQVVPKLLSLTAQFSVLHPDPSLLKNISLTVLFGSICNSNTLPTQLYMSICTHILHNIEILVGQKKL